MAHECEECGEQCYCDMDDIGGLPQPSDCPHFKRHGEEPDDEEWSECPRCEGSGVYNLRACAICGGTGYISEHSLLEDERHGKL